MNIKRNIKEEAVQHDDAAVPVGLWHQHLARKLGLACLSEQQQAGLAVIREKWLHKIWQKSVHNCYFAWLQCKPCRERHFEFLFTPEGDRPSLGNRHMKLCKCCKRFEAMKRSLTHGVKWIGGRYEWNGKQGRDDYSNFNKMLLKLDNLTGKKKEDRLKDIEGGKDCLTRMRMSTVWKWNEGSRLFFWRWGEFSKDVRDGTRIFVNKSKLPRCRKKQRVPKDKVTWEKVREKLLDVRGKGYIAPGKVSSITSFFDVPKGDSDIRMVYNGTSLGLNDAVWAPWFSLPTVETHLRAVTMGTAMCDCDIGEMFLNFVLDEAVREFAGVDFTALFPEECTDKEVLWERWTRMLMGFKPSPYCTTRDMKRIEEFLKGRSDDPRNPFRWCKVVLNLPGMKKYDPKLPWVFKVRDDGKMAGDLFIYIDDLRVTNPDMVDCWEGAHQVCCRLTWLGIQDAPRKRRAASLEAGAWAGTVIHTSNDKVTTLVSENKWEKTKEWIRWMKDHVDDEGGMVHKELERCRGFLIYVSRTYRPMKPYLRGLHKTIDGWRPGRDEDGWKVMDELVNLQLYQQDDVVPTNVDSNGRLAEGERVTPVPRLKDDILALEKMTNYDAPPKVVRRKNQTATVAYGFGDASGKGFGHALTINGRVHAEFGQWSRTVEEKHSNYKELCNLVNAVRNAHEAGNLNGVELFLFTDNFVAECAYYNGGSNKSRVLDELMYELWALQMKGEFTLHVFHVAGTRMIECGVDGLSRGDKNEGMMKGDDIHKFIPMHLSGGQRSESLLTWMMNTIWKEDEMGKLQLLKPEDWFGKVMDKGSFLWDVAPAAGEAAIEQLCSHVHGRPENTHIFLIPRLCTNLWRKQLLKVSDIVLTVDPVYSFWPANMHEPLLIGIYLPLLPPEHRYRPWKLKHTLFVEEFGVEVHRMQAASTPMDWDILRKFLSQAINIPSMPDELARTLLQEKNGR